MKITHTLTFPKEPEIERELSEIGIASRDGLILNFQIQEDDPAWPSVVPLVDRHSPVDIITTSFSKTEIRAAKHVVLTPSWHHGYPMPDDDNGYLETTYDSDSYCRTCGGGMTQTAPFRMRAEPKWGRRSILQLNWVFDEYFVKPELCDAVFRPHGIEAREVLHHKTLSPLETVVQLIVPSASLSSLKLNNHPHSECTDCGRVRYLPFSRGPWPPFHQAPSPGQMFWTQESFGSGASSCRRVVISHELCEAMLEHSVRGVDFEVIEDQQASNNRLQATA
jgi:hypothetical protein